MNTIPTLKPGALAFVDSFAGLVPCRVDSIEGADRPDNRASTSQRATVTVTADRGPYRVGEKLTDSVLWVIPRGAIVRRKFSSTIGAYRVEGGK